MPADPKPDDPAPIDTPVTKEPRIKPDPTPVASKGPANVKFSLQVGLGWRLLFPTRASPFVVLQDEHGAAGPLAGPLAVFNLETGKKVGTILPATRWAFDAVSPDGKYYALVTKKNEKFSNLFCSRLRHGDREGCAGVSL